MPCLPLGIIVFGVLSVPSVLAARVRVVFGKKRAAGDNGK
jgi:hypothetical protein